MEFRSVLCRSRAEKCHADTPQCRKKEEEGRKREEVKEGVGSTFFMLCFGWALEWMHCYRFQFFFCYASIFFVVSFCFCRLVLFSTLLCFVRVEVCAYASIHIYQRNKKGNR